jgi:SAM-dependent methyltransferase
MKNNEYVINLLAPYKPQLPLEELVIEVNKLFHASEADNYDKRHPEIHQQLPPIWEEMLLKALELSNSKELRILDFGCGTGFEAEQLIRHIPKGFIKKITCYDPSQEMLENCQKKIYPLCPDSVFTSNICDLQAGETYNLIITNSLLHHLPEPLETINSLLPLLSHEAIWLAGHEPSNRFYKSPKCMEFYESYSKSNRWRKYLSLNKYMNRLKVLLEISDEPTVFAAKQAYQRGIFKHEPPPMIIDRIVDFHVAHSNEEVKNGRGFDYEILEKEWSKTWILQWVKTYSFTGINYEEEIPSYWIKKSSNLAQKFPKDGANFCAIWRRRSE